MDENMLRYRRQFLLSREIVPGLNNWNHLDLPNGCHLYAHQDLNIAVKERNGTFIVLLGYLFDPVDDAKCNEDILKDIIEKAETFNCFVEAIKNFAGQYVFIFLNNNSFNVIHDPFALREVYYCTSINRIICGSQPNLLKEYSHPQINITSDRSIRYFHDHELKGSRSGRFWIGDETYFEGIKHLLPNHYLDITNVIVKRYWPREMIATLDLEEVIQRSALFLQGVLRAASHRYELMMAVTGGMDSRTLLAASRNIKDKIYYFINKHKTLNDRHPDIFVPSAIFKRIGLPFHIHEYDQHVDNKFAEIFLNNTFLSTDKLLPAIYNVYYKQHSNKLNILGVGEIGRTYLGDAPRRIDGFYLARSLKFKKSLYAVEQCQKWQNHTLPAAKRYNVNIMTLLTWEQLEGNWGVVGNSESDIAIEEFDPFSSHYLYETLIGIDKKYIKHDVGRIFKEMINFMWPELLEFPINPPKNKNDHLFLIMKSLKLHTPIKKILYKWDRLKYQVKKYRRQ